MEEPTASRNDIHIISRNSNWSAAGIRDTFSATGIYAGKSAWTRFIYILLLGLGVSFTLAGIIFFFAFNWADLHKFAKLGLIAFLVVGCLLPAIFYKGMEERLRNVLLTIATVLIGALYAVYGQIYQTGADAYDFFLGWTISVALWVIVSGFPVLWLIFLLLCNTTLILYANQVAGWDADELFNLLFLLNALFTMIVLLVATRVQEHTSWLSGLSAAFAITVITVSVCYGVFDGFNKASALSLLLACAAFAAGLFYGFRARRLLYLGMIPFAGIMILSCLILRQAGDAFGLFFVASLMIIGCTSLLIIQLVKLNKRWHEEQPQ